MDDVKLIVRRHGGGRDRYKGYLAVLAVDKFDLVVVVANGRG